MATNKFIRKTHGHTSGLKKSPTYRCWRSMMQRCYRIKEKSYPYYGGRGISVCDLWHKFENFLADMGEVLEGMTLDRIDSNGNYEPSNCRWANRQTQIRNRTITKKLTYQGVCRPVSEWAELIGMSYQMLRKRIDDGWSAERALTTPKMSVSEAAKLGGIAARFSH